MVEKFVERGVFLGKGGYLELGVIGVFFFLWVRVCFSGSGRLVIAGRVVCVFWKK